MTAKRPASTFVRPVIAITRADNSGSNATDAKNGTMANVRTSPSSNPNWSNSSIANNAKSNTVVRLFRQNTNSHRHNVTEADAEDKPVQSGTTAFIKKLQQRQFPSLAQAEKGQLLSKMRGHALTMAHLVKKGFNCPILIESKDGLEMEVPPEDTFTVDEVMQRIGSNYELDVIGK